MATKLAAFARSFWMHALILCAVLVALYWLNAALKPQIGAIDWRTFPLYARVQPVASAGIVAPIAVFAGWLLTLGWFWSRGGRAVPTHVALAFVLALNVSTAMVRGGAPAVPRPFTRIEPGAKAEYFADVDRVQPSWTAFLRDYPKLAPTLSLHSSAHPPGPIIYLWLVARCFGHGIVAAAVSAIIGTALSLYPFALLARTILGRTATAYAIALYAVTPSLVLFGATCMDGVFVFFPLLATYFFHRSWKERPLVFSILTGLALSAAMFFTFMTVCVGFVFTLEALLAVRYPALFRRVSLNLVWAGLTFVVAHCVLRLATGYDILRAFAAAQKLTASYRTEMYADLWHYLDVSAANLSAFLLGIGLITTALTWRPLREAYSAWRDRKPTDLLFGGFALGVALLAFSTIFVGETERVWMFLVPLALLPAARHLELHQSANPGSPARWMVLTLAFAQTLATESLLDTLW